jgi:hypothetical protein
VGSIEKKVIFLSEYSLDRNNAIALLFRTQCTPDFLIAEYYGLRNTIFWVTEDLAYGSGYVGSSLHDHLRHTTNNFRPGHGQSGTGN